MWILILLRGRGGGKILPIVFVVSGGEREDLMQPSTLVVLDTIRMTLNSDTRVLQN